MPGVLNDWLLAVDLDGTLLRHDRTIATQDRQALLDAADLGAAILLVTARFPSASARIVRQLAMPVPHACLDGALVFDSQQTRVVQHTLLHEHVEYICALSARLGARCFAVSADHIWHREQDAGHVGYLRDWFSDHPVQITTSVLCSAYVLLLVLGGREVVSTVHDAALPDSQVARDMFEIGRSHVWVARFRHTQSNKAAAACNWRDRWLSSSRHIAAIGNDYNDLPLFAVAARAYAMADSPPPVARAATQRLSSDGERGGGVAEALTELLGVAKSQHVPTPHPR